MRFVNKLRTLGFLTIFLCSPSFALSSVNCSEEPIVGLVTRAKKELNDRLYLTLATADPFGSPWNSPVVMAFDADYTFFWMSEKTSQHSRNIHQNNQVFAVVYNSTAPGGTGFGVYMQGRAQALNNFREISYGIRFLSEKAGFPPPPASDYQGAAPQRIYRFHPWKFWVNTIVVVDGKFIDRRIEITDCMRELNDSDSIAMKNTTLVETKERF